jgi:hypothetical protein
MLGFVAPLEFVASPMVGGAHPTVAMGILRDARPELRRLYRLG